MLQIINTPYQHMGISFLTYFSKAITSATDSGFAL